MQFSTIVTIAFAVGQACALVRSPTPTVSGSSYVVDGKYTFANRAIFNFATGTTLPSGLYRSTYSVGTHSYSAANAVVSGGYLNLIVPGGQTAQPYSCGEVVTTAGNIKYASVRTVAIFSEPYGVCNGIFYYKNDTQETDIEWLSDPNSLSNQGTRKLWFTNQDADQNGVKTYNAVTPPSDATSAEHEYRLDWTPGLVRWFVDGVQIWSTTSDVPNSAAPWVFNNWANGDPGWSVGPPNSTAIFRIKDVYMYYNTCSGSNC
ncbi:glycoside hydrolase family 16 protein [Colletotrichum camelliae]|nr:glycoside hydrolase family 16 protein [Colletotrichum camelliae]